MFYEVPARHLGLRPAEKKQQPLSTGIAADLRRVRKARGLTYEAVARAAGLPNANAVKGLEYGRNTELSSAEAKALGFKLELVQA